MDRSKKYTIDEASFFLKTSVYTVRRRIKENKLKAELVFGKYYVNGEDLYNFINKKSDFVYFNNLGDLKCNYKFILNNNNVFNELFDNILEEVYNIVIKKEMSFKLTSDLAIIYIKNLDKITLMCSEEEKNLIKR